MRNRNHQKLNKKLNFEYEENDIIIIIIIINHREVTRAHPKCGRSPELERTTTIPGMVGCQASKGAQIVRAPSTTELKVMREVKGSSIPNTQSSPRHPSPQNFHHHPKHQTQSTTRGLKIPPEPEAVLRVSVLPKLLILPIRSGYILCR